MSNEVKVSVLCITYNQKDYISDALDKEKKVFAIYQLVKKERKAEILSSYLFSRCFSEISGV